MNEKQQRVQDAYELLKEDLETRHEDIRHRAEFRGCVTELEQAKIALLNELYIWRNSLIHAYEDR